MIASARRRLEATEATARRLGYYSLEYEARLALDELDMKTSPALGRSRLTSFAAEARSHGLLLLARRAEHAISTADNAVTYAPAR